MRLSSIPQPVLWLLLANLATSQTILDSLSFGHDGPFASDISGWQVHGINHEVQFLSDRIILTPPVPGNCKGSLWSESTAPTAEWTAELQFRVMGQEQGGGNLQLWYTKDRHVINENSVYNADNFDGLALVIDQYGGQGGAIRGFLNDGSQNFRTSSRLEGLAFGHCSYAYRNRGRASTLRVAAAADGLTVTIDGRTCFASAKIDLPAGYHFGITSTTADTPDSFEIHRLQVSSGGLAPPIADSAQPGDGSAPPPPPPQQPDVPVLQKLTSFPGFPGSPAALPDTSADAITGQADQFADLHNRLQGLTHQVADVFAELTLMRETMQRQLEAPPPPPVSAEPVGLPPDALATIQRVHERVTGMEQAMQAVQRDVQGRDYRDVLARIERAVGEVKGGVAEHLPERIGHLLAASAPKMGLFLFVILAVQAGLVGAYIVYKRRRNSMPKKYL